MSEFNYSQFRSKWNKNLESRNYRECEKLCHDGLAKTPPDKLRGKLYNHLGYLYENFLEDKTFDDILEHYVLSLQVDESNASAHYNLSNFLLEQGMQHLLRALELNPKHEKAQKRLALLQPLKPDDILRLGNATYRCEEITEDGIHCRRVRLGNAGQYERTDETVDIEIGVGNSRKPGDGASLSTPSNGKNNQMGALNIESMASPSGTRSGCCQICRWCPACVFKWVIWILALIIAVIGVGGYFYGTYFAQEKCSDDTKIVQENEQLITDIGSIDVSIIYDCNNDTGVAYASEQSLAAEELLNALVDDGLTVYAAFSASCGSSLETLASLDEWSGSVPNVTNTMTGNSEVLDLEVSLEGCQSQYSSRDTEDERAFLCIPFVTKKTQDPYNTIEYTNWKFSPFSNNTDIYLAFITMDSTYHHADGIDSSLYAYLGALGGTGATESNEWDQTEFDCNDLDRAKRERISSYCPHCLFYSSNGTEYGEDFACNIDDIGSLFSDGVTQETFLEESDEDCKTDSFWTYFLAGVLPLFILTFIFIVNLCCLTCCAKSEDTERRVSSQLTT